MDDTAPAPVADAPVTEAPVAVEDNSPQPTPVAETTTSETPAPEGQAEQAPVNEPAPEAPQSESERQPSRAERRIQQLTGQLKELTQPSLPTPPLPTLPSPSQKLSEMLQGQESIDPVELDRMVEQREQAVRGLSSLEVQQLRQEIVQQRAVDGVEKIAAILPTQYAELNPDSPKYNPVLEEKIEAAFKAQAVVRNPYNPSQTMVLPDAERVLASVAKDYVEVARAAAEQGKAQTNATLAQQADNSAVTPTTDTPTEKSFADMSLSEQEAYLRSKGHDV